MRLDITVLFPDLTQGRPVLVSEIRRMFNPLVAVLGTDCVDVLFHDADLVREAIFEAKVSIPEVIMHDGEEDDFDPLVEALEVCAENVKSLATYGRLDLTEISPDCTDGALVSNLDVTGAYRIWVGPEWRVQREKRLFALEQAWDESKNILGRFGFSYEEIKDATSSLLSAYSQEALG